VDVGATVAAYLHAEALARIGPVNDVIDSE